MTNSLHMVKGTQQPAYGQSQQNSQQPTYGQRQQNSQQPTYGQSQQSGRQPSYGQNLQQSSYGQSMQNSSYGQSMSPYGSGVSAGQNYTPQNRPSPQPPQNNGGGKKTGLIIGIISAVVVIAVTVVILFVTGVFGKKEESTETLSSTSDTGTTVTAATTEAKTEAVTDATETPTVKPTEATTEKTTSEEGSRELDSEEIYAIASPSTVEIQAFSEYYGSQGTGFFDDDKGTVVTNYHVIEGMSEGKIITSDKKEYKITGVLGYDKDLDIAILSTDIGTSIPLIRKTDKVITGEKVYALGSSQGYSGTFTEGIVSTAEREDEGHVYIQHSAPITNGNSGGPLLDKYGHVMGINNWVRTDGQNLNFAIPIEQLDRVSRGSSMTLADVYAREYGGSSTASTGGDLGNGKELVLGSDGNLELKITVPEAAEVNDTTGTAEYVTDEGDAFLSISGMLEEGDPEKSLYEMNDEIIVKLEELLAEGESDGITFEDISSNTILIDGDYWNIYTTYGYMEEESGEILLLDAVFLAGEKDGTIGFIQMISVYENNENVEDRYNIISQLEEEMISTVSME